jgi:alanine racemase
MTNRAEAVIDLSAIRKNVALLKGKAGVDLLAVVKADAYGHGLIPVAKAALEGGASWLGVALLEEAITLRNAGIAAPILAWLVPPGSDFKSAVDHDIDTGMTRGGFLSEWNEIDAHHVKGVEIIGIFSHFARADEPGERQNLEQLTRFKKMVATLESFGYTNIIRHLSNSAATLVDPASAFDMVRTGIAMYGLSPDVKTLGTSEKLSLKPAMTLRAKLHLVKDVPAGSPVGYGATEITKSDTKLGLVAMGYADGIPRIAKNVGVTFNGKRAPIIGRVSMDQFVVDLGAASTAKSGDWVSIFGAGTGEEYTADDWGSASGSINYEIVTRIGPRVPRIYEL